VTAVSVPTVLLATAIEAETFRWRLADASVIHVLTGVGKAAAAASLTEAILKHHPVAVVNAGTAGTVCHAVGDILIGHRFIDRDLRPLAIHGLQTEIDAATTAFPFTSMISGESTTERYTVSTGDSFVTSTHGIEGDVVDMETFAEAAVCQHFGLPFVAVKYVTDIIGQNSVAHWEEKLSQARADLEAYFAHYTRLDL